MATSKLPRIYIDSCYYIDVVKGRLSKALDPEREKHIPFIENLLLSAANGEIEIWASTLVIAECLALEGGQQDIPEEVQKLFMSLLTSGSVVKLAAVDFFVAERARDLRWVDGIKCGGSADTIHVATALDLRCEEFITTNKNKGPLMGDAPKKLGALGLRVVEAPNTQVLLAKYTSPLLDI